MCYIRLLLFFPACPIPFLEDTQEKQHYHGNIIILFSTLCSRELGREDWLLRPSPILLAVRTLCPCHPSAPWQEVWKSICQNKRYPRNLWGHKNTYVGKKRNTLFDTHMLKHKNCKPSGKDKYFSRRIWPVAYMRKPTQIKHRGSATQVLLFDEWSETYFFSNKW